MKMIKSKAEATQVVSEVVEQIRSQGAIAHKSTLVFPPHYVPEDAFSPVMMDLKGKDYLTAQQRILWFVQEQRFILANNPGYVFAPYSIKELYHKDDETFAVTGEKEKWEGKNKAKYTTTEYGKSSYHLEVTDVFGNTVVGTGTETKFDFPDYDEKAFTKALGRAMILLGYSTGAAQDMLDGAESGNSRPVDAPQSRATTTPPSKATPEQVQQVKELLTKKGSPIPPDAALVNMSYEGAQNKIASLSA